MALSKAAGFSETGPVREMNQDRIGILESEKAGLYLIADGMGGHDHGEKASEAVLASVQLWWIRNQDTAEPYGAVMASLEEMEQDAGRKIRKDTPADKIRGTTVVLLYIRNNSYLLMTCGDSRCYLIQHRFFRTKVLRLSTDDVNPASGKLTQALGVHSEVSLRVSRGHVTRGDTLFLCTDGVYKCLGEQNLTDFFRNNRTQSAEVLSRGIKSTLSSMDPKDNYSAVVVTV